MCLNEGKGLIQSRVKYLNYSHLLEHGYTMERFRREFPTQKLKIDSIGDNHSKQMSGENHFNYGKHFKKKLNSSDIEEWYYDLSEASGLNLFWW